MTTETTTRARYLALAGVKGQTRVQRVPFIDLLDAERYANRWANQNPNGFAMVKDTETGETVHNTGTTATLQVPR